uniref:Mitochondrial import receptor subunit TOM7 homolog n=1 Tax=Arion vulgaris TaxID=1028688 RepID=A0A0B6Y445_9EUPU
MSDSKERVSLLMTTTRIAFYYGFIPTVIVLGFMKGADEGSPPLSILSMLWQ